MGFMVQRPNPLYYYAFFIALWNHWPLTSQINMVQSWQAFSRNIIQTKGVMKYLKSNFPHIQLDMQ